MALSQKADCFGKEADCVWELEKLGGDLKQAIDQRDLGENVALFRSFHRFCRKKATGLEKSRIELKNWKS